MVRVFLLDTNRTTIRNGCERASGCTAPNHTAGPPSPAAATLGADAEGRSWRPHPSATPRPRYGVASTPITRRSRPMAVADPPMAVADPPLADVVIPIQGRG